MASSIGHSSDEDMQKNGQVAAAAGGQPPAHQQQQQQQQQQPQQQAHTPGFPAQAAPDEARQSSETIPPGRTNKVENLLQSQPPREPADGPGHKDHLHNSPLYIEHGTGGGYGRRGSAGRPEPQQPPYTQRTPLLAADGAADPGRRGSGPVPQQFAQAPPQFQRRLRQHAATISEPMGPPPSQSPGMHQRSGSRVLLSPQQGSSFRYFQQQQQPMPPPQPRTATGATFDGRAGHVTASPQQDMGPPRRLSFIGSGEHYETSFSRSTSTAHYPASAQASPHGPYFPGGGQGPPPHHYRGPPPPLSAPSHQQHFSLPHGPQHYGARPPYGSAAGMGGQRSLSPPPLGRRPHHLPAPGRFDTGGGPPAQQRSPMPFPRISSPSMQQQPPSAAAAAAAAAAADAGANNTSQSPARESTRRLSSVVWGPTGFERLESGMSRCRICGKEYSKGSSTGTLKRHFRQHQVNVGSSAFAARTSPPAAARPRAYSHRTETTRTRRDASPFAPRMPNQLSHLHPHPHPQPPQHSQPPQPVLTSAAASAAAAVAAAKADPGLGDIDSSSAIAGSALLSMAAGEAHMAGERRGRPARSSDPSVYPVQNINNAEDPETRDISVSPSPSSSTASGESAQQAPPLHPPLSSDAMDIEDDSDGGSGPRRKRRRATVVGIQRPAAVATVPAVEAAGLGLGLGHELDSLTAAQLVALSSELVRRVAGALPTLAAEAQETTHSSGRSPSDGGDMLGILFRHVKQALLDQPRVNGALSPPASADSLGFPLFPSCPSKALPFTIRRQTPFPPADISVESLSLSEMTLLSRVSAAMQRIAPLSLAARTWDNVGVLLEAAEPRAKAHKVFLTIDLTPEVLDEALSDADIGVIVAYHPPIFSAWKSLTMSNLKQSLVLRCAAAGVSIYSPHTSLDSCARGINDWLASLLGAGEVRPIEPAREEDAAGQENVGSGRILELAEPQPLGRLVESVKRELGLDRIRVARAARHQADAELVRRVAICAGSGGSVVGPVEADLYFTGEMDHHSVLAALAKNTSCILGEHSNTERGFLRAVLADRLKTELDKDPVDDTRAEVLVSAKDRDPIGIE